MANELLDWCSHITGERKDDQVGWWKVNPSISKEKLPFGIHCYADFDFCPWCGRKKPE